MKVSTMISGGLLAGVALAAPLATRQATNIDTTVLQFALTLEHLENVFYKQALTNYTQSDFANAGYDATYYNNLKYIASDEEDHVRLLSAALTANGVTPNAACTYSFPSTDVNSFIGLSSILEGVGTSAYLGGAPLITSKDYLTVAGSILVTEALHTSYQRANVGEVPFPTPYGTPLDPTSVFTLAAAFIVKCPDSNAALPFTPYPTLTYVAPTCNAKRDEWDSDWVYEDPKDASKTSAAPYPSKTSAGAYPAKTSDASSKNDLRNDGKNGDNNNANWEGWSGNKDCEDKSGNGGYGPGPKMPSGPACPLPASGSTAKFTTGKAVPAGSYVTYVSGLNIVSVPATVDGTSVSASIPAVVGGQTYAFVTSADVEGKFDGTKVLYGPAIIEVAPLPQKIDFSYYKN